MTKLINKILIALLIVSCSACGKSKPATGDMQIITVGEQQTIVPLYFSTNIQPLKITNIISPIDGALNTLYFDYGETVKKYQLLAIIKSSQLANDYQTAFNDYLKAKHDYSDNKAQMVGNDMLHQLGILSDNEYATDKTQAYNATLSYTQATTKLQSVLDKVGISITQVEKLDTANLDLVSKFLAQPVDMLKIFAPTTGIALLPSKSEDSSSSTGSQMSTGSQIKAGQSLLMIGDISGFSLNIKVSEIYLDEIKLGQQATVTGDAFPDFVLHGQVVHINDQATLDQGGDGAPTFPVQINVRNITDKERDSIHVGMSAKVELNIAKPAAIRIPIAAVYTQNGFSMVNVVDDKTGKIVPTRVVPGSTSEDQVEIRSGLKVGDKVEFNAESN